MTTTKPDDDERLLEMWTVYDHPSDFPDMYVARKYEVWRRAGAVATALVLAHPNIDKVRDSMVLMGLTPLARDPNDDGNIVETWI